MRILVTGATGFLGSRLTRAFVNSGVDVVVLKRQASQLDRLSDLVGRLEFHTISNEGIAAAFCDTKRCDAVIHAATCYGRGSESWSDLNEANVSFPLRLLEKSLEHEVGIFLNIDTALEANVSAYALSKRQFVDWGWMAAMNNDSFRFINARLEHIYGPGDDRGKFVTALIHQCLANTKQIPLTEGMQKRDFIHVDDVVSGVTHLLQAAHKGQISVGPSEFDIGSECTITIRAFAELVHKLCDSHASLAFGVVPYRTNECMESVPNTQPLKSLGWTSRIALEEGLMNTINMERHR